MTPDKKYYAQKEEHEAKVQRAVDKARNRGSMMKMWLQAGNKLTKETQAEFNAVMKMADEDYGDTHKKK